MTGIQKSGILSPYFCSMNSIIKYTVILLSCIWHTTAFAQTSCISERMKECIKELEGLSLEVYMDGPFRAVGYGHRITERDPEWVYELEEYDEIPIESAETLFELDMLHLVNPGLKQIIRDIGAEYPQNVYDVMGSLIYNMGLAGLQSTEFYRLFKEKEYEESFRQLLATKSAQDGLLERRLMEVKILTENYDINKACYRTNVHVSLEAENQKGQ